MATIKESFAALGPVEWENLPRDSLDDFLKDVFSHAEELANSVPLPDTTEDDFPHIPSSEKAQSSLDTFVQPRSTPLDRRYGDLKKVWGKPINKPNQKDNPLQVWMYKAAAHDKRGAWFARRSIHKGLSFPKWKNAMRREFPTSLKGKKGPGSGAIRGLAGDARIEREVIDGVGNAEVWILSSAFPGPVSPRDFVALLCTSDTALTEASISEGSEDKTPPRHFLVVSKPCNHPEAGNRDNLVRGYYESIELAREIPGTGEDADSNLVEWIMITRSDPGGGIPRFMVERGTPGSIIADVPKWLEWAISKGGDMQDDDDSLQQEVENASPKLHDATASGQNLHKPSQDIAQGDGPSLTMSHTETHSPQSREIKGADDDQGSSSLLGNLTTAVGATVAGYLPDFMTHELEERRLSHHFRNGRDDDSTSSSSSDSDGTFASADEGEMGELGQEDDRSLFSQQMEVDGNGQPVPHNHHQRKLLELQAQHQALDEKIKKTREEEARKSKEVATKEEVEVKKQREKLEKERQKQEEKYSKELRQLEEKRKKEEKKAEESRLKEEKKAEERRRKAKEKDVVAKAQSERDEAKDRLKVSESENSVLRQQIEELQRENTILVQKLGSTEGGMDAIAKVKREALMNRSRASSRASAKSSKSVGGSTVHKSVWSTEKLLSDSS